MCRRLDFVATRVFADEELQRLRGFPQISRDELFRFFTLAPAESRWWPRVVAARLTGRAWLSCVQAAVA